MPRAAGNNIQNRGRKPNALTNQKGVFTPEVYDGFFAHYAKNGLYNAAAYSVGVSPEGMRTRIDSDPELQKRLIQAKADYTELLEQAAHERAVRGVKRPIIGGRNKDRVVAEEQVYSDGLLTMLMRANNPGKYSDKSGGEGGAGGGVLLISSAVDVDTWEALAASQQDETGVKGAADKARAEIQVG